ncbi:hypothetical protein EJB05_24249 [Eragrostis curvula]|uniref:Uncharacterized protein n=1 Tax=Eragrostis curvula TaxID=38414 RepID=A0A5J9VA56_9POAL|nr:hypothetical protein EJB05_24249 [Eragrostis curvula]
MSISGGCVRPSGRGGMRPPDARSRPANRRPPGSQSRRRLAAWETGTPRRTQVLFYNQLKLQLLQGAESAAGVMQEKDNIDPKYQIEIKALLHCHEYEIHMFFFLI